jgi:hypothetical protein
MRLALVVLGALALAAAGCVERTTNQGQDAAADGHTHIDIDASRPHDAGGDVFQIDGPPQQDAPPWDVVPAFDAQLDGHWDAHVVVPDGGAPTTACATAGGVLCTPYRWEICPGGTEPLAGADPHLGCGNGGWCCVVAPPSPCSNSNAGNCVPGACTGCWTPVPGYLCEAGRVCCQDYCD